MNLERTADDAQAAAPVAVLLDNHRAFLSYLERRIGDRALAEDILQDAFIKVVERPEQAPKDEGIVPWFYRTLRNAAIDRFRRRGAARSARLMSKANWSRHSRNSTSCLQATQVFACSERERPSRSG